MAIHEIRIDRSKTLTEEPGTGHNRWHPDIPPVVRCEPGDEVGLETRDALDGQLGPAAGAVPTDPRLAAEGLRTIPPREQAGNVDIKQLGEGAVLLIPVDTPGALFSAGDAHFAQGDCETCGTAIEMSSTLRVRFSLRKGEAAALGIRDLRFTRQDYYLPPEYAAPRRFFATTGISVTKDGVNHSEDVTLAARNALLNMIDHLGERGWTRQQGYAICSVAVDLKISQVVDAPNMLVSAFLPEDIFTS